MCGIAGVWSLDGEPALPQDLDAMNLLLAHRGPDGSGIHVDGSLGLAHTRLSILDPSAAGHQPMTYRERYWLTFNGEIYNFLELRRELRELGYSFSSDTDSEVILAAYAHWGAECQLRFNGIWAFAIWDAHENTLFLSRDRFGVKPLHFYFDGTRFAFASEMKAFLGLHWFQPTFDGQILVRAILDYNSVEASEDCLMVGIRRLRAGHSLLIPRHGAPELNRWWNTFDHMASPPAEFDDQCEQFRANFLDACRVRMRSDVPIATALSGGLDSSAVHCAMAHIAAKSGLEERWPEEWQRAFIATFPGTAQDERPFAEEVVRYTGAEAYYKVIDPKDAVAQLDRIIFDVEDIADILSSQWLLYRELRRAGTVVSIDGHGGDELFAGYHHQVRVAIESTSDPEERASLQTTFENMHVPGAEGLRKSSMTDPREFLKIEARGANYPELAQDQERLAHLDPVGQRLYLDFHYLTLPTILRNYDRCSMAHGVEIRAPFMDWRVVCLAFSLPSKSKLAAGFSKYIVRRALTDILPPAIRDRPTKLGFVSPLAQWIGGPLHEFFNDSVASQAFVESELWDGMAVRDLIQGGLTEEDPEGVRRVWEFIQVTGLIATFSQKATEVRALKNGHMPAAAKRRLTSQ